MKKFYLHNGIEQKGPFDKQELLINGIKKDTPIWFEGINEWTTADKVEELQELFKTTTPPPFLSTPPPIQQQPKNDLNKPATKKTSTSKIIFSLGALALIAIAANFVLKNFSSGNGNSNAVSYEEKVMTIEEIEKADPAKFLDASGFYRQNFWGTAMKVDGQIVNNATVANYKDVTVEVIFYSSTDTELDRGQYTIYDFFPAHTTKEFKLKIDRPQNCTKLGWEAVSATAY